MEREGQKSWTADNL